MATYDPKQTTVTIGTHSVNGYADGTFLSFEMDSPVYNEHVDLHGNTTRFKINNNNGTLTLTISQASKSNDILTGLYQLDRQGDTGTFPITIKDNRGTTLISSLGAWVNELPTVAMGDSNNNREWIIKMSNVGFAAGGLN